MHTKMAYIIYRYVDIGSGCICYAAPGPGGCLTCHPGELCVRSLNDQDTGVATLVPIVFISHSCKDLTTAWAYGNLRPLPSCV